MTDERTEQFTEHVRAYAELFGFDRGYVVVEYDPDCELQAQLYHHRDYPYAQITLGAPRPDVPFVDLEVSAAHECVHVVTNDLRQWMYQTVRRYLKKGDARVLLDQFEHEDERLTEVLARGIVAARRGQSHPGRFLVRDKPKGT